MENKEIDLLQLLKEVWRQKIVVLKYGIIGGIIASILAFSIPKEYETTVILAPEEKSNDAISKLSGVSAVLGLGGDLPQDGISATLYPMIIKSTPFLLEFMPIEIDYDGRKLSFYDYILNEQRVPWWKYIAGLPRKAISGIRNIISREEDGSESGQINVFKLTRDQKDFLETLADRLNVDMDRKSGIIEITSSMQDAYISALIADSVVSKINRYMLNYWTSKTRIDLIATERMLEITRDSYYHADSLYAVASDKNIGLRAQSSIIKLERLENEKTLAFSIYQQIASKLEMLKIKLQEQTPVVTVIEPASIPLWVASPKKLIILTIGFFIGGLVAVVRVVYKYIIQIK